VTWDAASSRLCQQRKTLLFATRLKAILSPVNRLKPFVAALLVFLWVPVASYCLVQACGITKKGACCPEEQSAPVSNSHHCDKPCGILASGDYLPHNESVVVHAPAEILLFNIAVLLELQAPALNHIELPSADPPVIGSSWLFTFRAASPPRAPSLLA
jgi:hypothetical protein